MSSTPPPESADADGNPLAPCPPLPNCKRTARAAPQSPDVVYRAVQRALEGLGPVRLRLRPETRRAEAVYRVGLIFKDDVDVAVRPNERGSLVYARSASRLGCSDLGVNRRRIARFFRILDRTLSHN